MGFLSELKGDFIPRTNLFKLEEPLVYYSARYNMTLKVPAGFSTDFSSIPRVAWTLLGLTPASCGMRMSGTVHDFIYRGYTQLSRSQADQLFVDAIHAENPKISWVKRNLCWQALRLFGASNYRGVK